MIDIKELRSMVNGAQFESFANSVIDSLLDRLEAAEKERDILRAKVSDSAINVEYLGNLKKGYEEFIGKLQDERNDLQTELKEVRHRTAVAHDTIKALLARIEEMEKQEPFDAAVEAVEAVEAIERMSKMEAALQIAVRQNSHDMLMTGDELRQCEAALEELK